MKHIVVISWWYLFVFNGTVVLIFDHESFFVRSDFQKNDHAIHFVIADSPHSFICESLSIQWEREVIKLLQILVLKRKF